ncbi:MAG: hypothetical protein OXC62_04420 [Aestuariivita sp.]|nr:hypothetical protein [Aestuariivita sp.]
MRFEQIINIVFVGSFPTGVIDERELFGGNIDPANFIKTGPILQCKYVSGQYELLCTPDRIDLRLFENLDDCNDLIEASILVADKLENLKQMVRTTAIGFNYEGAIRQSSIGKTGIQYCNDLINIDRLIQITGENNIFSKCNVVFNKPPFQYTIKIEPHVRSDGADLFFAVNGHQLINQTPKELFSEKIKRYEEFFGYTENLIQQIENRN